MNYDRLAKKIPKVIRKKMEEFGVLDSKKQSKIWLASLEMSMREDPENPSKQLSSKRLNESRRNFDQRSLSKTIEYCLILSKGRNT